MPIIPPPDPERPGPLPAPPPQLRHYAWAGLDWMIDAHGVPVLLEANRASHMLAEYLQFHTDTRPFELAASWLEAGSSAGDDSAGQSPAVDSDTKIGPVCLLWRRNDPLPDADEDACWIAQQLVRHLQQPPEIALVEDNLEPSPLLILRDGRQVHPRSIFRWWYGLPWTFERSGVRVMNTNAAWVIVRDKAACAAAVAGADSFRVPATFRVNSVADLDHVVAAHPEPFAAGLVIKPGLGWGGHGVRVLDRSERPADIPEGSLLCERIRPVPRDNRYWVVRTFAMAGAYCGGVLYSSDQPVTNYWQGGRAEALPDDLAQQLERPTLEAVVRIEAAAHRVHAAPIPQSCSAVEVDYVGLGIIGRQPNRR